MDSLGGFREFCFVFVVPGRAGLHELPEASLGVLYSKMTQF